MSHTTPKGHRSRIIRDSTADDAPRSGHTLMTRCGMMHHYCCLSGGDTSSPPPPAATPQSTTGTAAGPAAGQPSSGPQVSSPVFLAERGHITLRRAAGSSRDATTSEVVPQPPPPAIYPEVIRGIDLASEAPVISSKASDVPWMTEYTFDVLVDSYSY